MNDKTKIMMKKVAKTAIMKLLPIILIPMLIIVFLAAIVKYIIGLDTEYREGDMSSTPYAASKYNNGITIDKDGTIRNGTTIDDLWDEMIRNGSNVDEYLDKPEELARLLKAENVTQFPDTRKNPDEEIDWEKIINNKDQLQGIVKFKRTDSNNNTETMTYVDEATLQGYIDEYNGTGNEKAKENALKHFTLRKTTINIPSNNKGENSGGDNEININESKLYFIGDSWIAGLKTSGVAKSPTNYFYGIVGKYAGSTEMTFSDIKQGKTITDESAIVLYLGVNNPSSYNEMNSLIDELAKEYTNKKIYVLEVSHVNPDKYQGSVKNTDIDKYNEKVKSHCENISNVEFLNVASSVTDSEGKLKNTNDGLHLNNYQNWYDSIISAIKEKNGTSSNNTESESQSKNNSISNNSTAIEIKVDGDGYNEEYISSAGITYRNYKQYEGSYSGNRYWRDNPNGTISSSGCGPTSVAILASGLVDSNITPAETAAAMYDRHRIYRC